MELLITLAYVFVGVCLANVAIGIGSAIWAIACDVSERRERAKLRRIDEINQRIAASLTE